MVIAVGDQGEKCRVKQSNYNENQEGENRRKRRGLWAGGRKAPINLTSFLQGCDANGSYGKGGWVGKEKSQSEK